MTGSLVASIPSPSSGAIEIGPLSIHAYGLMIALTQHLDSALQQEHELARRLTLSDELLAGLDHLGLRHQRFELSGRHRHDVALRSTGSDQVSMLIEWKPASSPQAVRPR